MDSMGGARKAPDGRDFTASLAGAADEGGENVEDPPVEIKGL